MTCIRDARQKLEGYFVDTQHVAHKLIARSSKSRSFCRLRKSIKKQRRRQNIGKENGVSWAKDYTNRNIYLIGAPRG